MLAEAHLRVPGIAHARAAPDAAVGDQARAAAAGGHRLVSTHRAAVAPGLRKSSGKIATSKLPSPPPAVS